MRAKADARMRQLAAAGGTFKPRSFAAAVEQKPKAKDSKHNRANHSLESRDGQKQADHAETLKRAADARNTRCPFDVSFQWRGLRRWGRQR
jgi:hypothetical protein